MYRRAPRRVYRRARGILGGTKVKEALIGTAAGLAVSIGLTMLGKRMGQPMLAELGQRGGAIAATHFGKTPGQIGYQIGDAMFDRYLMMNGDNITGTRGVGV